MSGFDATAPFIDHGLKIVSRNRRHLLRPRREFLVDARFSQGRPRIRCRAGTIYFASASMFAPVRKADCRLLVGDQFTKAALD